MPGDDIAETAAPAAAQSLPPGRKPASRLLADFAAEWPAERVRLGDLVALLDDRAYGLLLLILAAPNIVPNPIPGLSGMLGVPLILVAAQLMLGRRQPWFPAVLARRSISTRSFRVVVIRVIPWLTRIERLLHPRVRRLTGAPAERILAGFCVLLAIVLALPIPLGNTPMALAITLIALGLVEHDGGAIGAGVAVGLGGLAVVSTVLLALVAALIHLLAQAV